MPERGPASRLPVVVMGVSGSGKSTLARALALSLQLPFVEGDDLHSAHNVAKMQSGQPLDDADRVVWLDAIAARLGDEQRYPRGVVVTCSALRRAYRDRLRATPHRSATLGLRFVFMDIDAEAARQRLLRRPHHFMSASLVPSQFATLERPGASEPDVMTLDARPDPARVLAVALATLGPARRPPAASDDALQ